MEQPMQQRARATRDRLRKAAVSVFARKGFHETKVSDIVAEAGVSQPTFYIYFTSKEAAYDALVEEFRAALHEATRQCLMFPGITQQEIHDTVLLTFQRFLSLLHDDRDLAEIGFYQLPASAETRSRMIGWIVRNMEQEQKAGILRADIAPVHQARLVVGLLDQMGRVAPPEAGAQDLATVCAKLFRSALVAT